MMGEINVTSPVVGGTIKIFSHRFIVGGPYEINYSNGRYFNQTMNEIPKAILVSNIVTAYVNNSITFLANKSYDNDGDVLTYKFSFGNGFTTDWTKNDSIIYKYSTPGLYHPTVLVDDGYGGEDTSSPILITIKPFSIPSPPQNLTAKCGDSVINLSWKPPLIDGGSPIIQYMIYKMIGNNASKKLTTTSNLRLNDTSVINGMIYKYQVTVSNKIGESNKSNEIKAIPIGRPTPPQNLSARTGDRFILLSWKPPLNNGGLNLTGYSIYRNITQNKNNKEIVKTTTGMTISFNDTNVTNGLKYYYCVTASNSIGKSNFSIEISAIPLIPNSPPIITSTPITKAFVGIKYLYHVIAHDPDILDILYYNLDVKPLDMTINTSNGTIEWIPAQNEIGNQTIIVNVTDGKAFTTQKFNITVQPQNHKPVITSNPLLTVYVGSKYTYQIIASDQDKDILFYSLDKYPLGMSIDSKLGLLLWTPKDTQVGNNSVVVNVTDGKLFVTQFFTIRVLPKPVNHNPTISSNPPKTKIKVGEKFEYDIKATDIDLDKLNYSLTQSPKGMIIDSQTGIIKWIPTSTDIGSNKVILNVSDGKGGYTEQTFTIDVVNNKPVVNLTNFLFPFILLILIILIIGGIIFLIIHYFVRFVMD